MEEKKFWSPARPIIPGAERDVKDLRHTSFTPSFETEHPQMGLILSWHYGRQWLEEREVHQKSVQKKTTKSAKFIAPDFTRWLEKRKPLHTRKWRASSWLLLLLYFLIYFLYTYRGFSDYGYRLEFIKFVLYFRN